MTPAQLATAGIRLYGRKKWKNRLAEALAVNVSTIHRICGRPEVPGPYEVAIKGLLANKKAMDDAAAMARKMGLVPRKRRKKVLEPKTIPYAGKPRIKRPKKEKAREEVEAAVDGDHPGNELGGVGR